MSKRHILKEVNAKSMCGMEIVVEQIYENIYEKKILSKLNKSKAGCHFLKL